MTTKFTVVLDDVATYGALVYQLGKVYERLKQYANDGEIIFPERANIETVLSNEPVGRWEIEIRSDAKGVD